MKTNFLSIFYWKKGGHAAEIFSSCLLFTLDLVKELPHIFVVLYCGFLFLFSSLPLLLLQCIWLQIIENSISKWFLSKEVSISYKTLKSGFEAASSHSPGAAPRCCHWDARLLPSVLSSSALASSWGRSSHAGKIGTTGTWGSASSLPEALWWSSHAPAPPSQGSHPAVFTWLIGQNWFTACLWTNHRQGK